MSRRTLRDDESEAVEINLSPMIDAIFILLIFFIVTTVFVEEQGLAVSKPETAAAVTPEENENVVLEITAENDILFDGQEISLAQVSRRVAANLASPTAPVLIRAHEQSTHATFIGVWDAARRGGAETLAFTTVN